MMYEELVKRLRLCGEGFKCRECDYINVSLCRWKMNNEAADAIEELQEKLFMAETDLSDFKDAMAWKEHFDVMNELDCKVPRWISVKERLPKDHERVLIVNDDSKMMIGERAEYDWWYKYFAYDVDRWDESEQGKIVAWMPLPQPPKEETE